VRRAAPTKAVWKVSPEPTEPVYDAEETPIALHEVVGRLEGLVDGAHLHRHRAVLDGLGDVGVVLERIAAEGGEVLDAGVMVGRLESVAVREVRVRHAELLRLRVHHGDEGVV
jgi:hypothetical protein